MFLTPPAHFMRPVSTFAVARLAEVDYNIANRVSENVASVVAYAYSHDNPQLATVAVEMLQMLDNLGSALITFVVWLVCHTP